MEKVNIKIELEIITHEGVQEHPFVNIGVNGYPSYGEFCSEDTLVDFDIEVEDDEEYVLTLEYRNKNPKIDVVLNENNDIVYDKCVNIKSVKIDDIEINLHTLLPEYTFKYTSTDPEGKDATGFDATKLSWNGKTQLKITAPIYVWLLENL